MINLTWPLFGFHVCYQGAKKSAAIPTRIRVGYYLNIFEPYNLKIDVSKVQSAIFWASFLDEVQHVTTSVAPSAGHCLGGFTTADTTRQSHLTRK